MAGLLSCFQGGGAFCEDPALIGSTGGCSSCQPAASMAMGFGIGLSGQPQLPTPIETPEMMNLPKMIRD